MFLISKHLVHYDFNLITIEKL